MRKARRNKGNFDLFSGFSWYTPGWGGMLKLLLFLFLGAFVGSFVSLVFVKLCNLSPDSEYATLISYPVMFIFAMIYAGNKSRRNAMFETGYALDSDNFGEKGGLLCALMSVAGILAAAFMTDLINSAMPPMPQWLEDALSAMTQGKLWVNFLCVSIFAPLFEEWLCRGEILRGLLNARKADGTRLASPALAITISAAFFAFIHLNPWQAIPAFIIGLLMGYVYYKTGSLKLTMLMHFTNNTFALICSNIDQLKDMDYWTDILPMPWYLAIFGVCALLLFLIIKEFSGIKTNSPSGNCNVIEA